MVDWITLVGTLLGAVVGVGASLLGEHARSRREATRELLHTRRGLYGEYLAAAARAVDGMRFAAQGSYEHNARKQAAIRESFRSAELYGLRFQLSMLAPTDVLDPAVSVLREARRVRDLLVNGAGVDSEEFGRANDAFFQRIRQATDAMRADLGVEPLSWSGTLADTGRSRPLTAGT